MHSGDLKVDAAAVDDEPSQDNEKHNCGGDRPPLIFAPPWVGPPAVVAARRTTSVFKVWVYHIRVRVSSMSQNVLVKGPGFSMTGPQRFLFAQL
jgi:hypothetical protein